MLFKPITHSSSFTTDKPPASPEIAKTEGKPPRGRPSSPDTTETESSPEDAPSWRRSASFRNRQPEPPSKYRGFGLLNFYYVSYCTLPTDHYV